MPGLHVLVGPEPSEPWSVGGDPCSHKTFLAYDLFSQAARKDPNPLFQQMFLGHEHSSQWHLGQGQQGESPAAQLMRSEGLGGQQGSCDF